MTSQRAMAPYGYLPQGAQEAQPPPAHARVAAADPSWARLAMRLPGGYASKELAIQQLMRRAYPRPDDIIARWSAVSTVITLAPGNNPLVWAFETLSIVSGIRAFLEAINNGPTAFDLDVRVNAGSAGGFIFGSDTNPTNLTALVAGAGDVLPIPVTPMTGTQRNQWTGTINQAAGVAGARLAITFYGFALWDPGGQIT